MATNALVALAVGSLFTQMPSSLDEDIRVALGVGGLTPETARFDEGLASLVREGRFRTELYEVLYENPWRTPYVLDTFRRQLATNDFSSYDSVSVAAQMLGQGSRRSLLGDPVAFIREAVEQPNSLRRALVGLKNDGILAGDIPSEEDVPEEIQQAAALILETQRDLVQYRRAAFDTYPDLAGAYREELFNPTISEQPEAEKRTIDNYSRADMKYLYAAGQDLAAGLEAASEILAGYEGTDSFRLEADTAWGKIVLSGGTDNRYEADEYLLVIDASGADTYLNLPANQGPNNWCSVVLDLAGNDFYGSHQELRETSVAEFEERRAAPERLGPAAALFGLVGLYDLNGDDRYASTATGLGAGAFGVALLVDSAGDDVYDAYVDALGYARFGIGVLEDRAGNDVYLGFNQVQGCGETAGAGLLIDRRGNDQYLGNDEVIDFPSPQSAEHNVTMGQGVGYGRRADYLTGNSLSGGIGVLIDNGGNDVYRAGVFAQGTGYWEGTGILWDREGNDEYFGQWYVQGTSAHFGIGYLEDQQGDDTYTALLNMAQGAGHDFGSGYLLDLGGNDTHVAPNVSLGAGNANGIGFLLQLSGDDSYEARGIAMGAAEAAQPGTLRERALTLGVFLDFGGNDSYPERLAWATNVARVANIARRGPSRAESQLGIFYDR